MIRPERNLYVIQHTDSEYLGRMEDHFEGRGIRFTYIRPHTTDGKLPPSARFVDGVIFLGGGPWGAAGDRDLPSLANEVALSHECLALGIPQIGIGLGALIVALGGGGKVEKTPLTFDVVEAVRCKQDALNGYMPDRFPMAIYMRDRPVLPSYADVLAADASGAPLVFQLGGTSLGFLGHPGAKRAMIEDLVMEFEESPDVIAPGLQALSEKTPAIEDALVEMMTGVIQITGLMQPKPDKP
ncbi:hypothetical protein L2D14_13810 [Thalassospiraceae bacterium LMO-JJ14]|nr:hypothetical protein L2D14_13810 [Thalassospiraceae bacterium LMO-JJ14]